MPLVEMRKNMNSEKTSLWRLLSDENVVIPIIQRDYAQGRKGKEFLRYNFLLEIKKALDALTSKDFLTMDFVYGTESRYTMNPLDGQQRLTTLWLLHWYLAFKLDILNEASSTLRHFHYETRSSSTEFCFELCNLSKPLDENKNVINNFNLLELIKRQTWFFSNWIQDPTIYAMLNMLCGTDIKDKKSNDIIDGIDEMFGGCERKQLQAYWDSLTGAVVECPLTFYQMVIGTKELPLSDDLYIKMNARGKSLTDLENLKADIICWARKQVDAKFATRIAALMDNQWTDIFWGNRTTRGNIDELFFAFINRYVLHNAIVVNNKKEGDKEWCLYGNDRPEISDSMLAYNNGFELYKQVINSDLFNRLSMLMSHLSGHVNEINNCLPVWLIGGTFSFIPQYEKDKNGNYMVDKNDADHYIYKVTTLTQPQRVMFFAISKYLESYEFDEISFCRWMRVACNLIENTPIINIDMMIARMKLIDELCEHCNDIYEYLASDNFQISSNASPDQLIEEISKAKKLLESCEDINWESRIKTAENHAFFRGTIRFLISKNTIGDDWEDFDVKWRHVQKYFDNFGLVDRYKILVTKALVKSLNRFEQLNEKQIFKCDAETWKYKILCYKERKDTTDNNYFLPIHALLIANDPNTVEYGQNFAEMKYENVRRTLCDSDLIDVIVNEHNEFRLKWYNNYLSMYRPNSGQGLPITFFSDVCSDINLRANILLQMKDDGVEILAERVENTNFYYGWNIAFLYTLGGIQYKFCWQHWHYIDIYDGDARLYDDPIYGDKATFTCSDIDCCSKLKDKLENCIKEYETIKHASI